MRNRSIKVVHLIESLSQSNHGVIEAALATSTDLKNRHGIDSEVWAPVLPGDPKPNLRTAALFPIDPSRARSAIEMAGDRNLNPTTTVVASHGCWQWPTRTAATLRRAGFSWVYSPHGMLEPWSLGQKRLRKWIFWKMIEGRRAKLANVVRATSTPEAKNLSQRFDQVEMIPHGVELPTDSNSAAAGGTDPVRVVFMGRLHPKKGVLPLARAWLASELANLAGFELVIIGNDDGELADLKRILHNQPINIRYVEPVYGQDKFDILNTCTYFVLPSESEGFPVALIESMAVGLIPMISNGCNLPEAFQENIAIRLSPIEGDIREALNRILEKSPGERKALREQIRLFVQRRFSLEKNADQQARLYHSLID